MSDTPSKFTQAGLRYSQVKSLIDALMLDEMFGALSFDDRKYLTGRIMNEIKGRMFEDIILLETAIAKPDKEVFKLQFADGEYDMVVFDSQNGGCEIYEIKYSEIADDNQYRHLINTEKSKRTEFRYGKIKGRYVIYRGTDMLKNGIVYLNADGYLNSLGDNS